MVEQSDEYAVITEAANCQFREKASRFMAFSYPVSSESACKQFLQGLKDLHPQATHHCYAYRIGPGGELYRANDDGEPSGTAGKPILSQILSAGLSDTLVVVVRYYGGTPLGASGLINAYKKAAQEVLMISGKGQKIVQQKILLRFHPQYLADLHQILRKYDWKMLREEFEQEYTLLIQIRKSMAPIFSTELTDNYILHQHIHRENID